MKYFLYGFCRAAYRLRLVVAGLYAVNAAMIVVMILNGAVEGMLYGAAALVMNEALQQGVDYYQRNYSGK